MAEESYHVDDSGSQKDYRDLQNEYRKKKKFIDVQLELGDKLFDAHRNVLSLYSPMLKAMFSDQWSAKKICPISEEFVEEEIMEELLNYLYTGKIDLTPDNVQPICMAAHYLQTSSLLHHSVGYLCKLLDVENVLPLFEFSTRCQLEELRKECGRFIRENSDFEVLQSLNILEFSFDNFKDLILELREGFFAGTLLRERTFGCIVRWTEKYFPERSNQLPVLLKDIPLEELPFSFLTETVSHQPLVKDSISCIEAVSAALENFPPSRQTTQNLIVIGGDDYDVPKKAVKCFDWRTAHWRDLPEMLTPRTNFGAAVINGRDIIVCGGYIDNFCTQTTAEMEMFEWANQTWTELPAMPRQRAGISMAICNGQLYVAGGQSGAKHVQRSEYVSKVMCYSTETKKWKSVKSMNMKRTFCQLIEHKNHLYAIGGGTNTVERYDPAQNEWTMMASMKASQSSFGATLHEDKIYVCGFAGFEVYDPETNVWTSLPKCPSSRDSSLVSINGKLLVVGGKKDYRQSNEMIYEYNLETKKWIQFCEKFLPLSNHCSVVGAFY